MFDWISDLFSVLLITTNAKNTSTNDAARGVIKRQRVSKAGLIYVLSAPMFSYYGENVYNIGYSENLKKTMDEFRDIPQCIYVYTKQVNSINDEEKTHALLCPFQIFVTILLCQKTC